MTTADETFQQTVQALRSWLSFLEEKKGEVTRQLERARRAEERVFPTPVAEATSDDQGGADNVPEASSGATSKQEGSAQLDGWL